MTNPPMGLMTMVTGYIDDYRGWDFVNGDNDPYDDHSHGTHTAGTIGASGNNGMGVAGVNWQVSLVPLKVFDMNGSGDLSTAMAALEYSTQMKFPITNNSWGGGDYSEAFENLLKENRDAGGLFVAAAGNNGSNNDTNPFYPASFSVENVISVAASDNKDNLASFSNYGKSSVHLAAPGVNILSTFPWAGDYYEYMSGTSMAAPHVAGAAALVKSVWPDLTYTQIKNKILESVDVIINPSFDGKIKTGGRLNLARAVGGVPSPLPYRLSAKSVSPKVGTPAGGTKLTVTGTGFYSETQVSLGKKPCTSIQIISQMELNCLTSPSAISGLHNVIVTNPDSSVTLSGAFRYNYPPNVTSLNPSAGALSGGNQITITGSQFATGSKVKIADKDCSQVQVSSANQLTCVMPSAEAGSYKVTVINPFGQESIESVQYTYQVAPSISSISPVVGPSSGGNTLTVNGAGFLPGALIRIQGLDCPNSNRVSETQMTCTPAARAAGTYNVVVLNPDSQRGVLASAYTYQAAPSISSISPTVGKPAGGNTLTISGTGFLNGATVKVGTKSCTNVSVVSSTQIRCTAPSNAEGIYNVFVTNLDGQVSPAVSTAVYRFLNPRWVATQGGACSSVCPSMGLASRPSPEGSYCTSGELIPASAVGKVPYLNGCWPYRDCRAQGTRSVIQVGQYCYGTYQRRDNAKTDITMGCYCSF